MDRRVAFVVVFAFAFAAIGVCCLSNEAACVSYIRQQSTRKERERSEMQ